MGKYDKSFVFIADPDKKFLKSLTDEVIIGLPRPITAVGLRDSQRKLTNKETYILAVFVNPSISDAGWMSVVKDAHKYNPLAPIFFITDKDPVVGGIAKKLGVQKAFKKPIKYKELLAKVQSISQADIDAATQDDTEELLAKEQAAAEAAAKRPKPEDIIKEDANKKEVLQDDGAYADIQLDNLFMGARSLFDVFMKDPANGNYIKVITAGDSVIPDVIYKNQEKGIKTYYILKKDQNRYMAYCDVMIAKAMGDPAMSLEEKSQVALRYADDVADFFRNEGVSAENMEYAQKFFDKSMRIVDKFTRDSKILQKFIEEAAFLEHATAVTFMGGLLVRQMGGEQKELLEAVGTACFFHDVALVDKPVGLRDEDPGSMSDAEKKLFANHPVESANVLAKITGMKKPVVEAVYQHHMRHNQSGFPPLKIGMRINRIAELVGICDEYVRLIKKAKNDPKINPRDIMKNQIMSGFSPEMVNAFRTVFFEKLTSKK